MRIFITDKERAAILEKVQAQDVLVCTFLAALKRRVYRRVGGKGLVAHEDSTLWYYPATEYLSDAAMLYCLYPEANLAAWLRTVTLDIARASEHDWAGPAFRDHTKPYTGHLETAHLCWAVAAVLDLADDVFTLSEKDEVRTALEEKGIKLCQRWIANNSHLANWRGILVSGVVVSASVLGKTDVLDVYVPELQLCAEAFQPDGSYAESLQYGNYLAFALMLGFESLIRKYADRAAVLRVDTYGKGINWIASSMLYARPMDAWGAENRARAVNFNDSAAMFRSSGDLLLHIAARHKDTAEAGLAYWLFEKYYQPVPEQGPHDLATFGMRNDWGFLTLPLLTNTLQAVSPQEAKLPLVNSFSNGHGFMRDGWEGKTVVAVNGGGDKLYGPGHLHGDVNSFVLVHHNERLLVDPGHSCYRNLIHGLESSSQTHNTCTFLVEKDALGLQEDLAKASLLEQKSVLARRQITNGKAGEPIDRGNRKLIAASDDVVSVIGCEAGNIYGDPIHSFSRIWLLAGSHVLFIVDDIHATQPVTTVWNWLVNNRDGKTVFDTKDHVLTVKRGLAGMKLFPTGNSRLSFPVYGYVHDAYHVEPNQLGEGKPGSGLLFRHTETESASERTVVHAIALDESFLIDSWEMTMDENGCTLTNGQKKWTLHVKSGNLSMISGHGRRWDIVKGQDKMYRLKRTG